MNERGCLMPLGDGTGPQGLGPMTGRGAGHCAGYSVPGYMNPGYGRGFWGRGRGWFGRGAGRGRGFRHWFYATGMPGWARFGYPGPVYGPATYMPEMTAKDEMNMLKDQAKVLQDQLKDIQERISTLEKAEAPKKP
jgi:hypothetical protein